MHPGYHVHLRENIRRHKATPLSAGETWQKD
jgi:hypothetical protein